MLSVVSSRPEQFPLDYYAHTHHNSPAFCGSAFTAAQNISFPMSAPMVESNIFNIPLSPPSSPHLSSHYPEPSEQIWQPDHKTTLEASPDLADMALVHAEMPTIDLNLDRKPVLRHTHTFPYTLSTAHTDGLHIRSPLHDEHVSPTSSHHDISNAEQMPIADLPNINFGGSAPASPISNLTPVSPNIKDDTLDQDLSLDMLDDDLLDDDKPESGRPMTAAEIRNQKRKMKRFRLTHNQTRFLMSEFARQAHPDAAHRERLAREIPGLSPRQVQVWFQNRRAKLKRLTSDDRERMMRSRALPDDFDMTQALHSPFGTPHVGGSLSTPTSYTPAFPEGNMIRPLNLDSLRRIPDSPHSSSPGGFTPNFPGSFFTPPQSVTDTMSPLSPAGDSPFTTYTPTLDGSPRSNPFATSPTRFTSHPSIPRLMHDRPGSVTSSPLLGSPDSSSGMMPYGLGLSYIDPSMQPFAAPSPTQNRMRSYSNNMPRRIELNTSCGNGNGPYGAMAPNRTAPTPQSATFPPYSASPLQASYSMLSAPHNVTSFPSTYMGRPEVSPVHQDFTHADGLGITGDDDDDGSIGGLGGF